MDRKHEKSVSTPSGKNEPRGLDEAKKILTVEDLAAVVGGMISLASEAKGPLGIGECKY